MCRNRKILEDILFRYHPNFKSPRVQKHYLGKNILPSLVLEKFVEQTMSYVGGRKLQLSKNSLAKSDFTDLSDCKVSGTRNYPSKGTHNSYYGRITNVSSKLAGGGVSSKPGALRVVVYVEPIDELRYYYIPKKAWDPHMVNSCGKIAQRMSITYHYNLKEDYINKIEKYRVNSFRQLCLKS